MDTILRSSRKRARVCLAGIFHGVAEILPIEIVMSKLQILGSSDYTWNEFEEVINLLSQGRIQVEPIITHEFSLNEMEKALMTIKNREALKVILKNR